MLPFQSITLENAPSLRPYLAEQPFRTCDYTLGAIFQWRAYLKSAFAVVSDMLIQRADYPAEGPCYAYPVGNGNLYDALTAVEADAAERNRPLVYCAVPEEGITVLSARYGERAQISSHRDWADYLYEASDLIDFPGKKYHTQRNHLSRFLRDYPEQRFVAVTAETLEPAKRFLDEYEQYAPQDKVIEVEEMLRARELLCDALALGQKAGYIDVGGTIVALAVGEVVSDTLYVHVEKARVDYAGAYQAIVSEFAKYAVEPDTRYINREDDSGEDGLRYSKLAYRPVRLVDKYWVTVR